jgi:hypothetical protein
MIAAPDLAALIYRNLRGALLLGRFHVLARCAVKDADFRQVTEVPDGADVLHHTAALRADGHIRVGFRHAPPMYGDACGRTIPESYGVPWLAGAPAV